MAKRVEPAPIKVLTIYEIGPGNPRQHFNNQNYSWTIDVVLIKVIRNDQKWKGYWHWAHTLKIEIEEVKT